MVHEVTNLSILQSILLSGIVVGLYTIIGGIEAVFGLMLFKQLL